MLYMGDPTQSGFRFHHLSHFIFLLLIIHGHSFDLPDFVSQDFHEGDILKVQVNKLTSPINQHQYSYYSLPFCRPREIVDIPQNLWQLFTGDLTQNSPYKFQMRVDTMCNIVCAVTLNETTAKELKEKIDDQYRVNMILDNIPLVVQVSRSPIIYQHGYPIGGKTKDNKYFINNHLSLIIDYEKDPQTHASRVVGFEAKVFSVNYKLDDPWSGKTWGILCNPRGRFVGTSSESVQEVDDKKTIIFTYDVRFQGTPSVKWAPRLNTYRI